MCSMLGRQVTVPLCHGGVRLRGQVDEFSDAAFMAGSARAERGLTGGLTSLCPPQRGGAASGVVPPLCGSGGTTSMNDVRSSAQGRGSEGIAIGVPGQREGAAWGAAARDKGRGLTHSRPICCQGLTSTQHSDSATLPVVRRARKGLPDFHHGRPHDTPSRQRHVVSVWQSLRHHDPADLAPQPCKCRSRSCDGL